MEHRRLRVLCLHGHGDNAQFLRAQLQNVKWDDAVLDLLDLDFLDAPFAVADGEKRDFPPPCLQWFIGNKEMTNVNIRSFEQGISSISRYMEKHGPFDGLLGMSLGGFVAGALAGMETNLNSILPTKIKFVIIISGGVIRCEPLSRVYDPPIAIPSFHLIGEFDTDFKSSGEELVKKFVKPVSVEYPYGHCLPPLDKTSTGKIIEFLQQILHQEKTKTSKRVKTLVLITAFFGLVIYFLHLLTSKIQ